MKQQQQESKLDQDYSKLSVLYDYLKSEFDTLKDEHTSLTTRRDKLRLEIDTKLEKLLDIEKQQRNTNVDEDEESFL